MLENYLLEELVAFADTGTLMATAARLHVTQPSVTRGMQKLENDLGVRLFDRQPNRITLTPAGQLAAKEAVRVLAANEAMVTTVRNFNDRQRTMRLGSTIPGPLVMLQRFGAQIPANGQIEFTLQDQNALIGKLTGRDFSVLFSNQAVEESTIRSRFVGTESLRVNLDQFMPQASQISVRFADLRGMSFIVANDIGVWRDIIQREIPDATFMYQAEQKALAELTTYTNFPYFTTNLTAHVTPRQQRVDQDDHVSVPISDASAEMPVYANFLISETAHVTPVLDVLQKNWPQ